MTGKLARARSEIQRLIEEAGGLFVTSVGKSTDYLVAGADVGKAKLTAAKKAGVVVIDEAGSGGVAGRRGGAGGRGGGYAGRARGEMMALATCACAAGDRGGLRGLRQARRLRPVKEYNFRARRGGRWGGRVHLCYAIMRLRVRHHDAHPVRRRHPGRGARRRPGRWAARRLLLVTGRAPERAERVRRALLSVRPRDGRAGGGRSSPPSSWCAWPLSGPSPSVAKRWSPSAAAAPSTPARRWPPWSPTAATPATTSRGSAAAAPSIARRCRWWPCPPPPAPVRRSPATPCPAVPPRADQGQPALAHPGAGRGDRRS